MPRAHRRRSLLTWVGVVAIGAGLAVLGYVAWQFWGTNWQSARKHEQAVGSLQEAWRDGSDTVRTDVGDAEAIVRIPRFGDDYAIPVLAGESDEVLAAGFGRFGELARPGGVGNYAIAGHRVTHGEPLRGMPELEAGDEVIVETREARHVYELVTGGDDLEVDFTEGWVADAVPTNPREGGVQPPQDDGARLLTLATCAELFHTDGRLVAFAVLKTTEPAGD